MTKKPDVRRYLIHPSVTQDRVFSAIERQHTTLDNPGICLACGQEMDGCEPDARNYKCECCGKRQVFGAEELMLAGLYHPDKKP